MPGVDVEALGELAVREPLALLRAEHLQHTEPERVAEGLQLLRAVDDEDVPPCRIRGLLGAHDARGITPLLVEGKSTACCQPVSPAAAASSRSATVRPPAERIMLAGVPGSEPPPKASATAIRLSEPVARK